MIDPAIKRLCEFIDASPTAYHATDSIAAALTARGAQRLAEREAWALEPGATYFVERNGSSLVAFRVGLRPPAEAGFALAGAHSDSPALKARIEKSLAGKGLERVSVELYGGPIVASWLDRPLSLAGRVAVRKAGGGVLRRLLNLERAIGVVPNLAIHLNRDINKGFEYNAQGQLPVMVAAIPGSAQADSGGASHEPWALRLVADELDIAIGDILGADLFFVDAQKSLVFGRESEMINSSRLDDLAACHAILEAFIDSSPTAHGQVAMFMDNEEIGSRTVQGADSSFLRDLLGRICALSGCSTQDFYRALASSFCASVDVAQAWHPSYAEKYDESFAPLLNAGPAVKANANMKYASDAETEARFRLFCEAAGVPCQKFMSRADMVPGSTIGPMGSSLTGIATVDVGHPLLSMHSIRETIGAKDHGAMIAALGMLFRKGSA